MLKKLKRVIIKNVKHFLLWHHYFIKIIFDYFDNETCMKANLIKYLYKNNKEFYNCNINKIINVIKKCLKIEKKCKKCEDINKNLQVGGDINNDIIKYFIDEFENKKNKILKQFII